MCWSMKRFIWSSEQDSVLHTLCIPGIRFICCEMCASADDCVIFVWLAVLRLFLIKKKKLLDSETHAEKVKVLWKFHRWEGLWFSKWTTFYIPPFGINALNVLEWEPLVVSLRTTTNLSDQTRLWPPQYKKMSSAETACLLRQEIIWVLERAMSYLLHQIKALWI